MSDLRALLERVEAATGPDRELDGDICEALGLLPVGAFRLIDPIIGTARTGRFATGACTYWIAPEITASLDAAVALIGNQLPGWWWTIGYCVLTNDAMIAPAGSRALGMGDALYAMVGADYRAGPASQKLLDEHPELDGGIDVARVGGNVALALCQALLRAKIKLAEVST